MGPIWGRQDPGGPHVGPMNFAIWGYPKHWTYRMFVRYILSCVLYQVNSFNCFMQYIGLRISLVMMIRIYVLYLIVIMKLEVGIISRCLGIGNQNNDSLHALLCSYDDIISQYLMMSILQATGTTEAHAHRIFTNNRGDYLEVIAFYWMPHKHFNDVGLEPSVPLQGYPTANRSNLCMQYITYICLFAKFPAHVIIIIAMTS